MFLLRRTALRAMTSQPIASSLILPKTRTFITVNQSKLRPAKQWAISGMQKRFAGDEATASKPDEEAAIASTEASQAPVTETEVTEEVVAEVAPEDQILTEPESAETTSIHPATPAESLAAAAAAAPSQSRTQRTDSMVTDNTLYVGNIFFDVKEDSLQEFFAGFGPLKTTKIIYDNRGLSKGFGYVEFVNRDDAAKAVEATNQRVFQGRRLAVQFHHPRTPLNRSRRNYNAGGNPPSKTLFIGNMSFEMSDKDLSDLFREVRNVIDVRIAIDRRTGQSRGFAHADFFDVPSATKAKEYLSQKELYGRKLRVDFSASNPGKGQEEST